MDLINSESYSDLKSQAKVIKIISELYNEDIIIDPKKDFKTQVLSNIERKNNNIILVKILFTILIHELEIKESSSEFKDIKNSIWAILKKDQSIEIFDSFITHVFTVYDRYDLFLNDYKYYNSIIGTNNIYEYINNFKESSVEDKVLNAIPLNYKTILFYGDFLEYLNYDVSNFINLFSKLDLQDDKILDIDDYKKYFFISIAFFLKMKCIPYYLENMDKIDNLKFNDEHLNYLLLKYIQSDLDLNNSDLESDDFKKLHYFKSPFISCFIERELLAMYENKNTHLLLGADDVSDNKRKDFFVRTDKIKNIINASDNKDFHRFIFNFLFDNFPIDYSILFINSFMTDFINSDFLEKIKLYENNIDDFNEADSESDSITFKTKFNKTIDFLLSGDIEQKIKQYLIYQEHPFNYHMLISDFINIYNNRSHYTHNSIKSNEDVNLEKDSNEITQIDNVNKDIPLKLSEYSNYKINTFIHSVYNSNYDKGEIDQKIVDFSLNLNIRQFQYFINGLVIYHEDNNLIFKRDDKVLISLYILNLLSENNSKNFDEYRTILRYFMNETPNIHIELKNNSDLDGSKSEYEDKVLEGLLSIDRKEEEDDSISLFSFEENEDDESFEENNKQEKPTTLFSEDGTDDDNDINLRPVDNNDLSNIMEIIDVLSEDARDEDEKNYVKEAEPKENIVSDEPLYEIFSAESEIEIQSYADDLGDEGKGVKNQLRRIRKTGNNRYLQSSSKFFENVDKLRDNFPNFEEFITAIEDYSILNQLGDNHFYIPPSLLVGDPGIGKTFFLSELSDTIGIENKMIHMETMSASWLLVGASSQWKDAKPGIVYDNIIKSKYANNIFILDELDKMMKSNYPVDNCLLQLFEKHTAKEFKDEYIPLKLDISKIIWLATANTLSTISDPILSRLQTYKIANPNFNERKKLAQNIYNHMLAENTWGSHFNPIIPDATLDKLCEPSDSIREMKKVLLKAITHSARRNDNVITIEDIISVNTTSKNKIGFM